MAASIEALQALRTEVTASLVEVHQKIDSANAALEERTLRLAALSAQIEQVTTGVRNRTEELFRETEIGFVAESQRTTVLVEDLRAKMEAVDSGRLTEVAEQLRAQDARDEQRMKFVMESLRPDINKVHEQTWKLTQSMDAEMPWVREQITRLEQLISTAPLQPQGDSGGGGGGGGRAPRLKIPEPKAWKLETLKGEANYSE